MEEKRIFSLQIKNHKIKKNLLNLLYRSAHLRNLLILIINEIGYDILNKNVLTKIFTAKLRKELRDYEIEKLTKIKNSKFYNNLIETAKDIPSGIIQQIILQLLKDYKSYFVSLKSYKKNPEKFLGEPKPPKPKKLENLHFFSILFTSQIFTQKNKHIRLTGFKKKHLKIKLPFSDKQIKLSSVRILKQYQDIELQCIYKEEVPEISDDIEDTTYITSIDLGVNNLAVLFTNNPNVETLIIKGSQIKELNQWFNKKKAELQSKIDTIKNKEDKILYKKELQRISRFRERKMKAFFHLVSARIIDYCLLSKSKYLIIAKNGLKAKQNSNMGKKNNQNFIQIPFGKIITQLEYKAKRNRIKLIVIDEAFTSLSDCLTDEIIDIKQKKIKNKKQYNFSGKRKGSVFIHHDKSVSNADVNGSINIGKVFKHDFVKNLKLNEFKRKLYRPIKMTIFKLQNAAKFCTKLVLNTMAGCESQMRFNGLITKSLKGVNIV